ncbi:MAG: protein kinase, partial [Leptolyngbya sp. RL_3_1]|nr:protein kinase [Leptolyngbya sp. RL_3_1]
GRSLSNHVVVRNSHVSRRHFELRPVKSSAHGSQGPVQWKLVSHGKNGTFLNGQPVSEALLPDGATVQLAPKGPVMKVYLGDRRPAQSELNPGRAAASAPAAAEGRAGNRARAAEASVTALPESVAVQRFGRTQGRSPATCDHSGNQVGNLLCIHCGHPVRVIRSVRHYKLLRLLAQGGMGTTFLAWKSPENGPGGNAEAADLTPGQRLVVVKQLNPEMASLPKAIELFEREAQVLQQMDHPGIPKFLDSFSEAERSYLVMELVHGQNLEQYLAQTGVAAPAQVLEWMRQVCEVLHHLHKQHPRFCTGILSQLICCVSTAMAALWWWTLVR